MGGKNAGGLQQRRSHGIRTSSHMAVYKGMGGGLEGGHFSEYETLVDNIMEIEEAEANHTTDKLPKHLKKNRDAIMLFSPIVNNPPLHHIYFLLWAATYGQKIIETDTNGKPVHDRHNNTVPKYPEIQGANLLNWTGVTSVADDFPKVNELIKTEPTLRNKFKPFQPFIDYNKMHK